MKIFEEINSIKQLVTKNQGEILDLLRLIDSEVIEEKKIKLYQKNNCLIIEMFSIKDLNCPFTFDFGLNDNYNQFRFYLHKSAPIIDIEVNISLLHQTKEALIEFFKSKIYEELTFVNNKLMKATYKYFVKIDGKEELVPHITIMKPIWFFGEKYVDMKEYKQWI